MEPKNGCLRCRELLPELAALPAARAQVREPHLSSCSSCREELDRYRTLFSGLSNMTVDEPREEFASKVMARIGASPAPAWAARAKVKPQAGTAQRPVAALPSGWLSWLFPRLLVPAVGLAAFLLFFVGRGPRPESQVARAPTAPAPAAVEGRLVAWSVTGRAEIFKEGDWRVLSPGERLRAGSRLRAREGASIGVKLPDASRVTLAGSSSAVIAGNWVEMNEGKGRFEIVHDPSRAFRVLVPGGEVRVLGTTFDVTVEARGQSRVDLISGRVEVEYGGRIERIVSGETLVLADGRQERSGRATGGDEPASPEPPARPSGPDVGDGSSSPGPWDARRIEAQPATGRAPDGLEPGSDR